MLAEPRTDRRRRVLVVEDESELAGLVALALGDAGLSSDIAGDLAAARQHLRRTRYCLVVLDLGLPDGDGLELCRRLRADDDYTPILILTARADEADRVVGLELGADDYLVKPFSLRELRARVQAILRRIEIVRSLSDDACRRIDLDGLTIEPETRRVSVSGAPVDLTATEFDLLLHLATHPGRVYTRAQLLEQVWSSARGAGEHTVNAHVNRLRAKIEPRPEAPHYVRTVWGVGYRFVDPREEA